MSKRVRRSLQNLGRKPGEDSGDVGGNSGKIYLFCLTICPPWKWLSRR
ncbi:unnamed protein product [Brassica oleracea var. botrytis]